MKDDKAYVVVLSRDELLQALSFSDAIEAIEQAQRDFAAGRTLYTSMNRQPAGERGRFQFYSACLLDQGVAGLVWFGLFPDNPQRHGLPFITGIQIINSIETGLPLAIMERSALTELVTAAFSAVGARYLASPEAKTLGILGCGAQGRSHIQALKAVISFESALAYDVKPEVLERYVEDMSLATRMPIKAAESAEDLIQRSDVVVLVTRPVEPTVKAEWLRPGALVVAAVDGGLYEDSYKAVDRIVICDWEHEERYPHFRSLVEKGCIERDKTLSISQIISDPQHKEHRSVEERIIFQHLGMAVNHIAAAHKVYLKAKEKELGTVKRLL